MNAIQDMKVEFSKENKSLKKTQTEIKSEIKKLCSHTNTREVGLANYKTLKR